VAYSIKHHSSGRRLQGIFALFCGLQSQLALVLIRRNRLTPMLYYIITWRSIAFYEVSAMQGTGLLFLLVGPSGAGKNTLLNRVLEQITDCAQMPTATTRASRLGEIEGQHHFFLTDDRFDQLAAQNAFVEWQFVHSRRYGTLKSTVEGGFRDGICYIADVEVLGAELLKKQYPDNVILIFITPSSLADLEQRIKARGAITAEEMRERLQRAQIELPFQSKCDYVVINDDLEVATKELIKIISEKRQQAKDEFNRHHRASDQEVSTDRVSR
jgi:guanylate kinase